MFVLFGIFLVLLLSTFVSAAIAPLSLLGEPYNVSHDAGSFPLRVNLTNDDTSSGAINWTGSVVNSPSGSSLTLPSCAVTVNETKECSVNVNFPSYHTGFITGTLSAVINASAPEPTESISFSIQLSISTAQDITIDQNGTIQITNTGNIPIFDVNLSASGDFEVEFEDNNFYLSYNSPRTITVSPKISVKDMDFGENSLTITSSATNVDPVSATLTVDRPFCIEGEEGENLTIRDIKINSDGSDDEKWQPLDIVTVEVEVKNEGDESINDVYVELAFFDFDGNNLVSDLNFKTSDEEKVDLGRVKDSERETATFKFSVPSDFPDGDYMLAVKAYSDETGEENMCVNSASDLDNDYYQDIEIERDEDNLVFVDSVVLSKPTATCGDNVKVTFEVYNIEDQDQDQVGVNIFNSDLDISILEDIENGIDAGEGEQLELSFTVPEGMDDGVYLISFLTRYDYNEDDEEYDTVSEDVWHTSLTLEGCSDADFVEISASLESDAEPGSKMTINTTITNTLDEGATFVIDIKDYEGWATLDSISDQLLTLDAGEEKEVELVFDVSEEATGEESFIVEVTYGDELETREVAVNIDEGGWSFFSLENKGLIWIIGIVNVVLIILIILVAVKISSR
jgi:uncharacterized membrane protein